MNWILLLLGSLAASIALVALVGAFLPRAHVASRAATFKTTPAELYAVARDFAAAPGWRTGVKAVALLPPSEGGGRLQYRETTAHHTVTYAVLEDEPARKIVTEIADRDLPYGGTWTLEFGPADAAKSGPSGGAATLRITERGEVKNVIFRFVGRFFLGHTATMETYLRDLGRKIGEDVHPQP